MDAEGFSIPPPDRTPWADVPSGSSLNEVEADENADTSSIMSTNRFRVDIMNETVKEDAEASHALTRVATLLKEVGEAFRSTDKITQIDKCKCD